MPPVPHGCVKAWLRRSSASFRATRRAERAAMLLRGTPIQERETFRATPCNCADRTQRRGGNPVRDGGNGRAERSQRDAPSESPCCFAAPRCRNRETFRATQVHRRKPSGRAKRRKPASNEGGRLAARGTAGSGDPRRTESGRVGRPGGGGRRRDFRERSRRDARSLRGRSSREGSLSSSRESQADFGLPHLEALLK
jgi:hypothetical protein